MKCAEHVYLFRNYVVKLKTRKFLLKILNISQSLGQEYVLFFKNPNSLLKALFACCDRCKCRRLSLALKISPRVSVVQV